MNKYIIEGIGTFFLVLTIALTGNPIAIGAILIAMIYMGGYISGGHYNPAVTLAVYVRGKITMPIAMRYMLAQIAGAIIAALIYRFLNGAPFILSPGAESGFLHIILIEFLFTFALASVVLHVATSDAAKGNYYYGLAIGFTVMAAAFAGGTISGGVFNPAVAIGFVVADISHFDDHFVNLLMYLSSQIIGAVLAARVYKYVLENKIKN